MHQFIYGIENVIEKTSRSFSLNNKGQETNLLDSLKTTCRKYTKEKTGKKAINQYKPNKNLELKCIFQNHLYLF